MVAPRLLNLTRARNVTPSLSMRASAPFSTMQLDPVVATMVRRVSGFLGYASVSGLVNDAVVCYLQTQLPELELEFEVMGDEEDDEIDAREAAHDLLMADLKASLDAAADEMAENEARKAADYLKAADLKAAFRAASAKQHRLHTPAKKPSKKPTKKTRSR